MLHLRRGVAGLVLVAIGGDEGCLSTEAGMGDMIVRERRGEESTYCKCVGCGERR